MPEGTLPVDPVEYDFAANEEAIKTYLTGKGLQIKTKSEIDKEVGDAVLKTHTDYEKRLAEKSGKEKPAGKKGVEWIDELFEAPKPKEEDPKPDNKGKSSTAEDEKDAKMKLLADDLKNLKTQLETDSQKGEAKIVKTGIKSSLKAFVFDGENADEKKEARELVEDMLNTRYKWKLSDDGDLVAYEGDDIVMNKETGEAATVSDIVNKRFKKFLFVDKKIVDPIKGTGTNKDELSTNATGQKFVTEKSLDAIKEKAIAQGFFMGSDQYRDFVTESAKQSGLKYP